MSLTGNARLLLVAGTVLAVPAPDTLAQRGKGYGGDELARVHRSAGEIFSGHLPSLHELQRHCRSDAVCAGEILAVFFAPHGRLERVPTPSSDAIRGVVDSPSLSIGNEKNRPIVRLNRFGRDVIWELRTALQEMRGDVVLDLRGNGGGDFDRMLRVAGLFCGAVENAIRVRERGEERWFSIPGEEAHWKGELQVWIGRETASSAEVLAALLQRHGNATLLGERTFGKDVLVREVAVTHGWRLLVPAGNFEIDGVALSDGLLPDRKL